VKFCHNSSKTSKHFYRKPNLGKEIFCQNNDFFRKRFGWLRLTMILTSVGLLSDCAYFNTYYNADKYFNNGVKEYSALKDGKITVSVRKKFDAAIEKSNKVLAKYPDSKWSDDAQFIIALSAFYKGDYLTAKKKFEEFLSKYPSSKRMPELQIWYGRNLWKMGEVELALHQLRKTARTVDDDALLAEVYFTMSEIFQAKNSLDSALIYLKKTTDVGADYDVAAQAQFKIAEIYLQKNDIPEAITNLKRVSRLSPTPELKDKMQILLAKIYRESGRFDEAIELVSAKLNDAQNEKIWGDLELQMALIYLAQKDYESASSRLSQITEKYKGKPVSAEAYYHLANLNMTHFHDYEKAQSQFDLVGREDSKSAYLLESKMRSGDIKRYFNVKKSLTSSTDKVNQIQKSLLNDGSQAASPINQDANPQEIKKAIEKEITAKQKTVDTTAIFADYYKNLYELAEIYYFNFEQTDSAVIQYEKIVHSPLFNKMIDKALYALYFIYEKESDTTSSKFYLAALKEQFPKSPYLAFIENREIVLPDDEREAGKLYLLAENLIDQKPDSAILVFKRVNTNYSATIYGEKSAFAVAWVYHQKLFSADSAIATYQRFIDRYPRSVLLKNARSAHDDLTALFASEQQTTPTVQPTEKEKQIPPPTVPPANPDEQEKRDDKPPQSAPEKMDEEAENER